MANDTLSEVILSIYIMCIKRLYHEKITSLGLLSQKLFNFWWFLVFLAVFGLILEGKYGKISIEIPPNK